MTVTVTAAVLASTAAGSFEAVAGGSIDSVVVVVDSTPVAPVVDAVAHTGSVVVAGSGLVQGALAGDSVVAVEVFAGFAEKAAGCSIESAEPAVEIAMVAASVAVVAGHHFVAVDSEVVAGHFAAMVAAVAAMVAASVAGAAGLHSAVAYSEVAAGHSAAMVTAVAVLAENVVHETVASELGVVRPGFVVDSLVVVAVVVAAAADFAGKSFALPGHSAAAYPWEESDFVGVLSNRPSLVASSMVGPCNQSPTADHSRRCSPHKLPADCFGNPASPALACCRNCCSSLTSGSPYYQSSKLAQSLVSQ